MGVSDEGESSRGVGGEIGGCVLGAVSELAQVALEEDVEGVDLGSVGGGFVGDDGLSELNDLWVDGRLEVERAAVGDAELAGRVDAARGAALPAWPYAHRQLAAAVFGAGRADEVDSVCPAHGGR